MADNDRHLWVWIGFWAVFDSVFLEEGLSAVVEEHYVWGTVFTSTAILGGMYIYQRALGRRRPNTLAAIAVVVGITLSALAMAYGRHLWRSPAVPAEASPGGVTSNNQRGGVTAFNYTYNNNPTFSDPPAFFLPREIAQEGDHVRVAFPIGGGSRWGDSVSFMIRLARPCISWRIDNTAFFPVLKFENGGSMSGGAWRTHVGTKEKESTAVIYWRVDNTPLREAKAVVFLLEGIDRADVLSAEAHPAQSEVAPNR